VAALRSRALSLAKSCSGSDRGCRAAGRGCWHGARAPAPGNARRRRRRPRSSGRRAPAARRCRCLSPAMKVMVRSGRAARLRPDADPTGRGRSACHVGAACGLVEVRAVARGRAALPVVRTRRISLIAVDELTARRRAASQIGLPRSTARTIRSRRSKETGAGMTSNHGRRFPRNRERLQPPGVWASDGRRRYRGQRAPRPAKTTPRVLERM
jgi:hypothetical protein